MIFEHFSAGGCQSYLVGCADSCAAVLIDPEASQIDRLESQLNINGMALVPLKIYFTKGFAKVLLGLGKGKKKYDKREDLKKRESDREVKRAQMHRFKGK